MSATRKCDNCGRVVPKEETIYEIKIELYAKAEELEIDEEDLEEDHMAEIEAIIEALENVDVEEVTDQVYESYKFDLCPQCRENFHSKLKLRAKEDKETTK
jgi:Asp-tRNA(Asn)/Glu-tRNA(Gln) amidotransferase C subunit